MQNLNIFTELIYKVPLGVLLKNENRGEDMVEIVLYLHQYVPAAQHSTIAYTTSNGKKLEVPQYHLEKVLFGGDQLTTVRARSAKKARVNCLSSVSRLEGLIPCTEDFHVKLNFLDVIDHCSFFPHQICLSTWYHVPAAKSDSAGKCFHRSCSQFQCDDFFKLVVHCHILAAAMKIFKDESS